MNPGALTGLLGRVLLALIFLASAFGKITNFEGTTQYMAAHGMPLVTFFCIGAILLEGLGGLSLALGFYARLGAVGLAVFLVPATLIFHHAPDQRIELLKNLAILGGLLIVVSHGAGEISLDAKD